MNDVKKLTKDIVNFRNARDWKQFHNPKDLSISLVLEATEVLEHFQWKSAKEMEEYSRSHKKEIGEELADTLYWILLLGNDLKIDVLKALEKKIKINNEKYPVEKSKGNHKKYTELK